MKRSMKLATLVVLLGFTIGTAAAGGQWLHVRVDGQGRSDEQVNINIPLSLVETVLPLIQVDELQNGKLIIDDADLGDFDLREILNALRDTPDTTFVTVQSEDESVRVAKEGDYLLINVDEKSGRSGERVRVRVPLAVIEALIGDHPDELDLLAGLRALGEFEGEDLIRIESEDANVRVWVDSSDTGL